MNKNIFQEMFEKNLFAIQYPEPPTEEQAKKLSNSYKDCSIGIIKNEKGQWGVIINKSAVLNNLKKILRLDDNKNDDNL